MLLWFLSIAVLGGLSIGHHPEILGALSPHHGVTFFQEHGWHGFKVLGGVVLAVTGGEALYADMAHFGRGPINRAWLLVCLPSLIICYFGEGALLLDRPEAAAAPFYSLCPGGMALYPFVLLATLATIIASQALSSGVFSLTHQAVQLGFFPRVTVKHTSSEAEGQIYVPLLNWGLMVACCLLVVIFRESSKLAAAFGLAVSGTMAITSVLFYVVTRNTWGWSRLRAGAVLVLFLSFDIPFLIANALKFFDGGYVPFVVASVFVVIMATWRIGRGLLADRFARTSTDLDQFLAGLETQADRRIPGTGVFLASLSKGVPPVLMLLWERLRVVHERALLVTVVTEHEPVVPEARRSEVTPIGQGFYRVILRYGFTEQADIPQAEAAVLAGLECHDGRVVYVLGKETFIATSQGKMGATLESIFAFLSRNARNATDYFRIPPDQVLELGSHIDL
jgi:KUP system potassium uptake protein